MPLCTKKSSKSAKKTAAMKDWLISFHSNLKFDGVNIKYIQITNYRRLYFDI